jgi:hypothetical protein
MAIKHRNVDSSYSLAGVFATTTAFLADARNGGSAVEGDMFYDTTLNILRTYDGSSWSAAGQSGTSAGSLDDVLQVGAKATNTDQMELERTYASGALLVLDQNSAGASARCVNLENASNDSGSITLDFASTNGYDIDGTGSTWSASYAGVIDAASVTLVDAKTLVLGTGSDATLQFDGTSLILAAGADDLLWEIGDSAATQLSWDLKWYGNAANGADYVYFDASENLVYTIGVDLRFGDNDVLNIGTGSDVSLTWNATNLLVEAATDNTGQIRVGSTNAIDLALYGSTNTNIALFDVNEATYGSLFDLNGWDIRLQDDDQLLFGDGSDIVIDWNGTNLLIEAGAQDTGQIRIGSSNAIDFVIYDNAATGTITNDVSTSTVNINGWDIRLQDDDYLLLGDSATAGGTTDGTIRWDATNTTIEIIGATQFENNVTMDGNLTLSGTLTMSGALAPGSISLNDAENLVFGDGTDYTISTAGSTAALIITAANANDAVNIGDGAVATDFLIDNAGTAGADVWFDASADTANGAWYFGANDIGVDVFFYGATASAAIQWDQSADTLVVGDSGASIDLQDNVTLLFGTGASNAGDFQIYSDGSDLFIKEVSAAGKGLEIGENGKGIDVKMFGETADDYCEFDQSADAYLFEDIDIGLGDGTKILFGDTLGTGDISLESTAGVLSWAIVSACEIYKGADGTGIDETWFGDTEGDYMKWDMDGNTNGALIFEDTTLQFVGANVTYSTQISTDACQVTATDHSAASYVFGANGTNGMNVTFNGQAAGDTVVFDAGTGIWTWTDIQQVITGVDNSGTLLAITGNDAAGNSDTVTINSEGTGSALKVICDDADSVGFTAQGAANQTTSLVKIDGNTAEWIGADDVGMLHLDKGATALADAGASMLYLANASQPPASAEGFMVRIIDAGAARAGTYCVEIESASNEAIHVDSGTVVVDETVQVDAGIKFNTTTTIFTVKVELTNADIKGLAAAPKELVAAQGADTVIEFVGATFVHDYGSEVLTESADNMAIKYDGAAGTAVTGVIEATGFVDAAADTIMTVLPAEVPNVTAAASVNKRLALDNTGDGEYGGNASADTTWTIFVSYRVHTVGLA